MSKNLFLCSCGYATNRQRTSCCKCGKPFMKTFIIEYELPPLRAIYHVECDAESEADAMLAFEKKKDEGYRVRKVYEKDETPSNS